MGDVEQLNMQNNQHNMGASPQGNPQHQQQQQQQHQQQQQQQQQQQDQQQHQLMSPAGGQAMQMTGAFSTILPSPMGNPNGSQYPAPQYVFINPQGQQVQLFQQANFIPGMTAAVSSQPQQQGQYIIGLPPKQPGGQQPQMMVGSQSVSLSQSSVTNKNMGSQANTYMTSAGMMTQAGSPGQPIMIQQMAGGQTLASQIKAEPGKPMQHGQPGPNGPQQPMILQQGMAYINPATPGPAQTYFHNGQLFVRPAGPQEGQGATQLMFTGSGGIQMQPHTQPSSLQPGLSLQLPPGLTTSMQPMANNAIRPPVSYASHTPAGKTQISRAPPILPATNSATTTKTTTSTTFTSQPSPKSKQKMSPRNSSGPMGGPKGALTHQSTANAAKSILSSIKASSNSSSSPPILGSPMSMMGGGQSSTGLPVLQSSLAPPPSLASNLNSQPPLLTPMMAPTSGSTTTTSYLPKPPIISTHKAEPLGKLPIMPVIKKTPLDGNLFKPELSNGKDKSKQDCLTHVIGGHVIKESSQPFPLDLVDDDQKGKPRKRPDGKAPAPANPPATPTSKADSERKRGPGRPPGSTKQSIEHQKLLQHDPPTKPAKDGPSSAKKAKQDFEVGPPTLTCNAPPGLSAALAPASAEKAKFHIDVVANNPLKWSVTQVCDFVKGLPGCSDYVEDFQLQEIDGQALMLLKADHLMSAMAIKLGPALKICNAIDAMREELKQN